MGGEKISVVRKKKVIKLRKKSTRGINRNFGEERMRRTRTRMEGEEDEEKNKHI
jgi:hypothetical protein